MAAPLSPAELKYQLAHINQSISGSMVAINIALPVIATAFVVLRMIARQTKRAPWQADDFVILSALVGYLVQRAILITY